MDQNRTEFYKRISRASQRVTVESPVLGPSKSRRMVRNERIAEMLGRQKAFTEELGAMSVPRDVLRKPALWTPILSFVLALSMGALAAMLARYLKFRIAGAPAGSADLDMGLDVIFAIAIAFLLRELVSLSAVRHMGAQLAGILLAVVTMHNMVHRMPETFTRLFSPDWVSHVTETTEPGTLNFRGQSYHI